MDELLMWITLLSKLSTVMISSLHGFWTKWHFKRKEHIKNMLTPKRVKHHIEKKRTRLAVLLFFSFKVSRPDLSVGVCSLFLTVYLLHILMETDYSSNKILDPQGFITRQPKPNSRTFPGVFAVFFLLKNHPFSYRMSMGRLYIYLHLVDLCW